MAKGNGNTIFGIEPLARCCLANKVGKMSSETNSVILPQALSVAINFQFVLAKVFLFQVYANKSFKVFVIKRDHTSAYVGLLE